MAYNNKTYLLLDSDIVIHLSKAERIAILNDLFPNRIKILDIVYEELKNNKTTNKNIEFLNEFGYLIIEEFPNGLLQEYFSLKKMIKGAGESACLIYCKHNNDIIASSNTSDIVPYCKEHNIAFLTTLDIFAIAIEKGFMTNIEANEYIKKITYKNSSYLCCCSIEKHLTHFDKEKYLY